MVATKHTPVSNYTLIFVLCVSILLLGFGSALLWWGVRVSLRDFIILGTGMVIFGFCFLILVIIIKCKDIYFCAHVKHAKQERARRRPHPSAGNSTNNSRNSTNNSRNSMHANGKAEIFVVSDQNRCYDTAYSNADRVEPLYPLLKEPSLEKMLTGSTFSENQRNKVILPPLTTTETVVSEL